VVPARAQQLLRTISTKRLIDWLRQPTQALGPNGIAARDSILTASLDEAVAELTRRFGANSDSWRWGQPVYHHATILHPLAAAADSATRERLDVGPAPRGGDANTVAATGGGDNQTSGASFRIVVDVGDWEKTLGVNTPGQSGNPDDAHYRDLFPLWATDRFFAVPYARDRVKAASEKTSVLIP
jgi:penicillin G amidase